MKGHLRVPFFFMKIFFLFLFFAPHLFAQNAEKCLNDKIQISLFMHMKKDIVLMDRDCSQVRVTLLSEYELKKNQLIEYKLRSMNELRESQVSSEEICKKNLARDTECSKDEENKISKLEIIQKDYKQTCMSVLELIKKLSPESRCGEEKFDVEQIVIERSDKNRIRAFDLNDEMDVKTKSLEYKDE